MHIGCSVRKWHCSRYSMGMTHGLKILVILHSPPYKVHQFMQSIHCNRCGQYIHEYTLDCRVSNVSCLPAARWRLQCHLNVEQSPVYRLESDNWERHTGDGGAGRSSGGLLTHWLLQKTESTPVVWPQGATLTWNRSVGWADAQNTLPERLQSLT